jgi:hypothetical protein
LLDVTVGLVTVPSPGPSCEVTVTGDVTVAGEVTVTGGNDETVVVGSPPPGPSLPPRRATGVVVSPEPPLRRSSVPVVEPPLLRCVTWRWSTRTVATAGAGVGIGNTT